jgi:uncharacterized protein
MSKLALGTVQFGLDYGINNSRGRVPKDEVFAILNRARQAGIDTLDTAYGYGESEAVLGEYLRGKNNDHKIISKLPKGKAAELKDVPADSLKRLGISQFYGYLLHDLNSFIADPSLWALLQKLKQEGLAKKIGFSLYYPAEVDQLLEQGIKFDLVQVPYNIFDRRFEDKFAQLKKLGVEVHVRSVFLQGLAFKAPQNLPETLRPLAPRLEKLRALSERSGLSLPELCLGFVLANDSIDKVVVGVDGLDNLNEIINSASGGKLNAQLKSDLAQLREDDEALILPINWKVN